MAGITLGAATTWNVSNTGAAADPLAEAYGVSLAAVGLLTTALFVTHLLVQIPSGRASDRLGARRVALVALALVAAGNGLGLLGDAYALGLAGRTLMGLGTGAAFVAGLDLVRAGGGGPFLAGVYGGGTMAGGGLAIAVVPLLDGLGWRAPFWSGIVLALACVPVVLAASPVPVRGGRRPAGVLRDSGLLPLGVVQAASFGLAVVAGNWVVALLERQGHERSVAGLAGSLILLAGVVTRPGGGLLAQHRPQGVRILVCAAVAAAALGAALLAAGGPLAVALAGAALLGLASGVPFAAVMSAAQRLRPDAPAAAVGLVNGVAVASIFVLTPLLGLAFELPGDGRLAYVAIASLAAASVLAAARARF